MKMYTRGVHVQNTIIHRIEKKIVKRNLRPSSFRIDDEYRIDSSSYLAGLYTILVFFFVQKTNL